MTDTCAEHRAILNAMQSGDTAHIYEITIFHMEQPKTISLEDLEPSGLIAFGAALRAKGSDSNEPEPFTLLL